MTRRPSSIVGLLGLLAKRNPLLALPAIAVAAALSVGATLLIRSGPHVSSLDNVSLTANDDGYAIAWSATDAARGPYVALQRLASDGSALGAVVALDQPACRSIDRPALAWSGKGYGVLWICSTRPGGRRSKRQASVYFQTVTRDGQPVGRPVALLGRERVYSPQLTWNGTTYAATWVRFDYSTNSIAMATFDESGAVETPPRVVMYALPLGEVGFAPTENGSALAWGEAGTEPFATRVSLVTLGRTGSITERVEVRASQKEGMANVGLGWSPASRRYGVTWTRWQPDESLRFASVEAGRAVEPRSLVPLDGNASPTTIVATDGEWGIAWSDEHGRACFVRCDRDGKLLGPVTQLSRAAAMEAVNLVWAHGSYAVTWVDNTADSRVHFVRISRDGKRQGEERILTR